LLHRDGADISTADGLLVVGSAMHWFFAGLAAGILLTALAALWWMRRALRAVHRSHERLQRSNARARRAERLAEIGTLTGGLAHEIKNPLSTMKINLQLLGEDLAEPADDRQRRSLRRCQTLSEQVSRLEDILADFLQYAGRHELHPQPRDLNHLIEELVDFFEPQARQARIRILPSYSSGPLVCSVDVDLIKQALLNLFLNAQQAMPDGGELIVRLRRDERHAEVDVIDTGTGIAPEKADRIFEAYWSSKPGGSGLGLPLVRRVIEEHSGRITFTSAPGKGTQFTVRLPLADEGPTGSQDTPDSVEGSED
jgi:signal transduction histidine kinase